MDLMTNAHRMPAPPAGLAELPYDPTKRYGKQWQLARMGDGIPEADTWQVRGATDWRVTDHAGRVYRAARGPIDHTSHHYRSSLGLKEGRPVALFVQQYHGGGHSAWELGGEWPTIFAAIGDETAQYLFCDQLIQACETTKRNATDAERQRWASAYVEGRIRKSRPKGGRVSVSIETAEEQAFRTRKAAA